MTVVVADCRLIQRRFVDRVDERIAIQDEEKPGKYHKEQQQ
jgi:hypothetical protein